MIDRRSAFYLGCSVLFSFYRVLRRRESMPTHSRSITTALWMTLALGDAVPVDTGFYRVDLEFSSRPTGFLNH